jgi:hypothetical protein
MPPRAKKAAAKSNAKKADDEFEALFGGSGGPKEAYDEVQQENKQLLDDIRDDQGDDDLFLQLYGDAPPPQGDAGGSEGKKAVVVDCTCASPNR